MLKCLHLLLAVVLTCISFRSIAAPGDEHWDYRFDFAGVSSSVIAMHADETDTFAAGVEDFSYLAKINRWNGKEWSVAGTAAGTSTNSFVFIQSIARRGQELFVGGLFTSVNDVPCKGLARWDGVNWSSIGSVTGVVYTLCVDGNDLYAGGSFTGIGSTQATNIARWDGIDWHPVGGGVSGGVGNTPVTSIVKAGAQLYVAGDFKLAGGIAVTNIASWNGSSWAPLGNGLSGGVQLFAAPFVSCLAADGDTVYAGGTFATAGTVSAKFIARWNGSSWSALGSGVSTNVFALAVAPNHDLYVGGDFASAGGITANGIAKWNGSTWSALGSGLNSGARKIQFAGTNLHVGGLFDSAGGIIANHVASWNGSTWLSLGHPSFSQGAGFIPRVLANGTDGVYAGGTFFAVGSVPANRIARFDGTSWYSLGTGVRGTNTGSGTDIKALAVNGTTVYVGGIFTNAGSVSASHFARWNGTAWDAMGITFNQEVRAIATNGNDLYVGGYFTSTSAGAMSRIAKWNGSSWSALGSGLNSNVLAIAASGNDVYAGGIFTNAGGIAANRIAKWNGSTWSALGLGITNGTVIAITINGSDVYVGGTFTNAGGIAGANRIALWNGSSWSGLGSPNNTVSAIAVHGDDLYVSGTFTNIAGVTATRIAKWDGSNWSALGSGLYHPRTSPSAVGLAFRGDDLYTSGTFEIAGGKTSKFIARWNETKNFNPPIMDLLSPSRLLNGSFRFQLSGSGIHGYTIEGSPDLLNWTPFVTNNVPDADIIDTEASVMDRRFYRAVWVP